nr:hypothetical protein [Tanacetum cinerariifolium]
MSVKYPNYVNLTSSSEEQPNERTPSPPPRKKSLLPPQAPSKSISSKSTHCTSSSSPIRCNMTCNMTLLFPVAEPPLACLTTYRVSHGTTIYFTSHLMFQTFVEEKFQLCHHWYYRSNDMYRC